MWKKLTRFKTIHYSWRILRNTQLVRTCIENKKNRRERTKHKATTTVCERKQMLWSVLESVLGCKSSCTSQWRQKLYHIFEKSSIEDQYWQKNQDNFPKNWNIPWRIRFSSKWTYAKWQKHVNRRRKNSNMKLPRIIKVFLSRCVA